MIYLLESVAWMAALGALGQAVGAWLRKQRIANDEY